MAVVSAILAVTVGMWAVGSLTEPEAAPVTETTPSPSDPTPEGLGWERVATLPKSAVYALAQLGDEMVVFTSSAQSTTPELTGLRLWHSADGLVWEQGDSVVDPGSRIQSVTPTALGIVALGFAPDDDSLRAWLSDDGDFWLPLADGLPLDTEDLLSGHKRAASVEAGMAWGNIGRRIGGDASVFEMAVKDERGIALVTRSPERARPYDIAGVEIWTARLP
jgi:hypothetical protein